MEDSDIQNNFNLLGYCTNPSYSIHIFHIFIKVNNYMKWDMAKEH